MDVFHPLTNSVSWPTESASLCYCPFSHKTYIVLVYGILVYFFSGLLSSREKAQLIFQGTVWRKRPWVRIMHGSNTASLGQFTALSMAGWGDLVWRWPSASWVCCSFWSQCSFVSHSGFFQISPPWQTLLQSSPSILGLFSALFLFTLIHLPPTALRRSGASLACLLPYWAYTVPGTHRLLRCIWWMNEWSKFRSAPGRGNCHQPGCTMVLTPLYRMTFLEANRMGSTEIPCKGNPKTQMLDLFFPMAGKTSHALYL